MSAPARLKAWRRGLSAEWLCVLHLRARGYRVLARRLRTPLGEIDILAARGRVVAAIEVKARDGAAAAAEAVLPRQRARIGRAAAWALAHRPELAGMTLRLDAMLVTPWRLPRHLTDAWRPDDI